MDMDKPLLAILTQVLNMYVENSVFDEGFFPDHVLNLDRELSELRDSCPFVALRSEKRKVESRHVGVGKFCQ